MDVADCIIYAGLDKFLKAKIAEICNLLTFLLVIQLIHYTHAPYMAIPPVPTCGSIWVVLWLFCFRPTPSSFPQ